MAAATMSLVQQSSQLFAKQSASSRPHTCGKPTAWLCRPAVRIVRPATVRRAQQCNSQGPQFRANWGPNSRAYWQGMAGPAAMWTLAQLWKEFERMNGESEGGRRNSQSTPDVAAASSGRVLAVDIEKDEDGYTLTADVPGLTKEDLKVQVNKDRFMTISFERKRREGEGAGNEKYKDHRQYERNFGKFSRKLKLPEDADIDCISARVEAGVLYLSIRRLEVSKPVDVPIY